MRRLAGFALLVALGGFTAGGRSPISTATAAGSADAVEIGVGRAHTCARTGDGRVRCWGSNRFGQLGDGTRADRDTPGQVVGLPVVAAIAVGLGHTCARTAEGLIYCWGHGAVGDGTGQRRDRPVRVEGVSGATDLVAGGGTSCVREGSGAVKCWGSLTPLSAGDGKRPVEIPALRGARRLALAAERGFAMMPDGSVLEWGKGDSLGSPRRTFDMPQPGSSVRDPAPVDALAGLQGLWAGGERACVRTAQGGVACWGGECGGDDKRVLGGLYAYRVNLATAADTLAVGESEACAFSPRTPLRCWCAAEGIARGARSTAKLDWVWNGPTGVRAVALGERHRCILGNDAKVSCWGENDDGQLGEGTRTLHHRGRVALARSAVQIAAGTWHACARADNGTIQCWGQGDNGQLGDGGDLLQARPVKVVGIVGAVALAAHAGQTCAIVAGQVWCWGVIPVPLRADQSVKMAYVPVRVAGVDSAVALALGVQHGCARLRDGSVRCWGENQHHQLGNNSTTWSAPAVAVPGLGRVTALAAGEDYTCALSDDGLMRCWGRARLDALGPDSEWPGPTLLPGGTEVVEMGLEERHGCIRHRDGQLRCWDSSRRPQSAAGGVVQGSLSSEPRGSGATQLRVFPQATCIGVASGGFQCWGGNAWGELQPTAEIPADADALYPLDIPDAVELAGGLGFLCARTRGGGVFCQGSSKYGQVGDGTADRDTPTPVRW